MTAEQKRRTLDLAKDQLQPLAELMAEIAED